MDDRNAKRKIRRDESVAIACGVAASLLIVSAVLVYLWFA